MSSSSKPRIERVMWGSFFPPYAGEEPKAYWATVEQQAENLKRVGVTHVLVNQAPLSILQVMDPENSYLRFTTYGHTPDKYVSSSVNEGIYHPSILELNRQALLWQVKLARQFGFRCWVRCVEMTMMPESFFQRHPSLRGARVDNPACSTSPRFALCPMVPEVQDHYRQLIRNLLALAPDIDELHIFTNDSGAGFCYSSHLYSGPNGPYHCKNTPPGKQAQAFCKYVLEAGREANPGFRVVMTSGLSPAEKVDFVDGAPEGVASSIFGAFAWGGGLEDRWQNMAVGPDIHQPAVRRQARAWAYADMQARAAAVTRHGGQVYASYNADYYSGPSDAPRPWETHESMTTLLKLGARNIIGGAWGSRYHANGGIFKQFLEDGAMPTDKAVRQLAVSWVGDKLADRLCEAWRLSEHADREWPMTPAGGHAFFCQPLLMAGPIIPNPDKLKRGDLNYFYTAVIRDEEKMRDQQGGAWRFLNSRDPIKHYIIRQLETVVLPADTQALAILDGLLSAKGLTPAQRECLEVQRREIGIHRCYMERVRNWYQAAFHVIAGCKPYKGLPPLPKVIEQEIATSQRWHEFEGGKGKLTSPRQKLMLAHRNDPVKPVDMSRFPFQEYQGLDAWPGAHRPAKK